MSGANGVYCSKCEQDKDMGLYDIIKYNDGTTRWKLQCFTCDTIQPGEYDPDKINAWYG